MMAKGTDFASSTSAVLRESIGNLQRFQCMLITFKIVFNDRTRMNAFHVEEGGSEVSACSTLFSPYGHEMTMEVAT